MSNRKSRARAVRIVAGNWRSRLLQIADVPGLRPTSERIRETLFNWLTEKVPGATCLDLCAGTGALGLEALSRGAGKVIFLESSRIAHKQLTQNIALLEATGADVTWTEAEKYLEEAPAEPCDIVFVDPPFSAELHAELCRLLETRGWLADDARIYIEMSKDQPEWQLPDSWQVLKDKTAGNVRYQLVATGKE